MLRTILDRIGQGQAPASEPLWNCLAVISAREADLQAWVEVAPRWGAADGPLSGVPFAAKDTFETEGMSTAWGSPLFHGRRGQSDAALVRMLLDRGAVLAGKTQTTAFAYFDPAPTRNPRAPGRTPGGSSSGSAAAVAAGMVPVALGSQTQGSVIRPASYCGVCGFKPTFGLLPVDGLQPFAPSLDTAGLFTASAADMALLWERLGISACPAQPVVFGLAPFRAEPAMQAAIAWAAGRLRRHAAVEPVSFPAGFESVLPAVRSVNDYEGARSRLDVWREYGPAIGAKLDDLVKRGLRIPERQYQDALDTLRRVRGDMAAVFERAPVLLTPAAPGPAPRGLKSTGDPVCNAAWTGLHCPAVSVPIPLDGPPLGLQLVAAPGQDALLLSAAGFVEAALA